MHSTLVSFSFATLLLSTASLSSASGYGASHYSHAVAARNQGPHGSRVRHAPAHAQLDGQRMTRQRAIKQGPLRLGKRAQEAVLKCTSDKTFALCDGDRCTDMGSVAAGTMCKDGAITWDTSYEATPEDSSSASSSIAAFVSSKSSSASAADVLPTVKLNAVVSATSLTTPGAATATTTSSSTPSTSTSASSSGDDDDWVCDDVTNGDDSSSASSSSTARIYTTTSSAPAQTTPASAKANVNLNAEVKSQTTSKAVVTTTTQAPVATTTTTSSAPAVQVSASVSVGTGSSGGDWLTGGKATFFYQYGAYGACGKIHADSDKIVALQMARYGSGSNNAPDCGRQVEIKNDANGKTVVATVADACPGCANYNSLDLSVGAFDAIGDQATGVLDISWKFIS